MFFFLSHHPRSPLMPAAAPCPPALCPRRLPSVRPGVECQRPGPRSRPLLAAPAAAAGPGGGRGKPPGVVDADARRFRPAAKWPGRFQVPAQAASDMSGHLRGGCCLLAPAIPSSANGRALYRVLAVGKPAACVLRSCFIFQRSGAF